MDLRIAIPEPHVDREVLDAGLETTTRLNERMLSRGLVPTFRQALAAGKVRWQPEPPGAERFDHAGLVLRRGWGDCDDLGPWHAASLRATGEDPHAEAVVTRTGPKRWHAIVHRGDGSIDDPSREAGMGTNERGAIAPVVAPIARPASDVSGAYFIRPQLALRMHPRATGMHMARADIPWHSWHDPNLPISPTEYSLAMLHTAPTAHQAIVGAIHGVVLVGEAADVVDPDHVCRLRAIADYCRGLPLEHVHARWGPHHAKAARQLAGVFGIR